MDSCQKCNQIAYFHLKSSMFLCNIPSSCITPIPAIKEPFQHETKTVLPRLEQSVENSDGHVLPRLFLRHIVWV